MLSYITRIGSSWVLQQFFPESWARAHRLLWEVKQTSVLTVHYGPKISSSLLIWELPIVLMFVVVSNSKVWCNFSRSINYSILIVKSEIQGRLKVTNSRNHLNKMIEPSYSLFFKLKDTSFISVQIIFFRLTDSYSFV
jgi:hypothetical protein